MVHCMKMQEKIKSLIKTIFGFNDLEAYAIS